MKCTLITLRRRSAFAVCAWLAATFAVWSAFRYSIETQGLAEASWGFYTHTDTRLHTLLWGATAAIALELYPRPRELVGRYLTPPVWAALASLYVALWAELRSEPTAWEAIVIALLIVGTACRPQDFVGRVLEWQPMRAVGRLSYSLYLTNNVLVPFAWLGRPLGLAHTFPVNIALTILTSIALHRYVERPMIRLGHRLAPPSSPGVLNEEHPIDRRLSAARRLHAESVGT